ncbi:response regulator [Haloquadratum walsbyi]|jgi:Response regulators consisting of a CheY-like receiver domain and a winged-helix DNA-binding domain|uniref:HoxA-like transcriptional regulator n=1 Tax=Haloquadratum walsbyi J07HQW2 TaxID=1238425 RepID=U1MVZ4_9EURY|nr:response regulator [Haloquadratum walsbyi]ERG94594.1 MAG: HoxA-like transcriptional regulator [Haloquadratum walsbyi J07HQW2]
MSSDKERILVVEDEPELADLYAVWLSTKYSVDVAYGAQEAITKADESFDIMILDRRMPEQPGRKVLREVRDAEYRIQVAMVTAVEPDFDILEMEFDDYAVKPISREDMLNLVSNLIDRESYSELVNKMYELSEKKALLEERKDQRQLSDNGEYQQLIENLDSIKQQVDEKIGQINTQQAFKNI